MPVYASYVKLTTEGGKNLKDAPQRLAEVASWVQAAGGKVIAAYASLGRFDYLYITEMPDSRVGLTVLAKLAMGGNVSTETVELVPLEEWIQIVQQA